MVLHGLRCTVRNLFLDFHPESALIIRHPCGQCVRFQIRWGLVDRQPSPVVSAPLNPCMLPTPSSRKRSPKVSEFSVFLCDNSSAHFDSKMDMGSHGPQHL